MVWKDVSGRSNVTKNDQAVSVLIRLYMKLVSSDTESVKANVRLHRR